MKMQLFYLSLKTWLLVILKRIFNLQLSLTGKRGLREGIFYCFLTITGCIAYLQRPQNYVGTDIKENLLVSVSYF